MSYHVPFSPIYVISFHNTLTLSLSHTHTISPSIKDSAWDEYAVVLEDVLTTMLCSTTTTFIHPMGEAVEAKYDPSQTLHCHCHPCVRVSTYVLKFCTYNACRRWSCCIYPCVWRDLWYPRCPKQTHQWMLWRSMNGCYRRGKMGQVSVMYDASIELVRHSYPLCSEGYVLNQS